MRVMVTRPKPEGERLCERIRAEGGDPLYFPMMTIVPTQSIESIKKILNEASEIAGIIFVSPRGVALVAKAMASLWPQFPSALKVAAVGAKTAEALKAQGIPGVVYPQEEWSSEGLLALPEFQQVADKKIIIVRGEGGRELLAETLQSRGAKVTPLVVYRRAKPEEDASACLRLLQQHQVDIIVITSTETLQNCLQWIGEDNRAVLLHVPLIVISERLKNAALSMGFQQVILAKNADHESIIDVLKEQGMKNTTGWKSISLFMMAVTLMAVAVLVYWIYLKPVGMMQASQASLAAKPAEATSNALFMTALQQINDKIAQQGEAIRQISERQGGSAESLRVIEETYRSLMAVDEQLNQLTLATPETERNELKQDIVKEEINPSSWWQKGWQAVLQTLNKIVIIRKNSDQKMPLILPDEREFLYQNCHARVATAVWALLHHDPVIYQTSLANLEVWIKRYFVQSSDITRDLLNRLDALQKVAVEQPVNSVETDKNAVIHG